MDERAKIKEREWREWQEATATDPPDYRRLCTLKDRQIKRYKNRITRRGSTIQQLQNKIKSLEKKLKEVRAPA